VIIRTDAGLVARRLDTGRAAWSADLPIEHRWKGTRYGISRLADEGWYQLAADDARVYAVGDFLPTVMPPGSRPGQGRTPGPEETNSSTLACFSLDDGRELWKVGYGRKDNPEQLVDPKFGCPPLVAGERLYALSLHELTCLVAASGKMLWQRVICQSPPTAQNRGGRHVLTPGTSPAIFAGRVFACSNGGVVAALDAQDGHPIWLRQYDSGLVTDGRRTSGVRALKNRPVNPVVVAGLSLIALPVDSEHVLAFDLLDGASRWTVDRGTTDRLTGAGPGRVLLTGRGGWRLLRTFDGKQVAADSDLAVWGIPAVTTDAAYLSARDGRVIRIDLATGKSRSIGAVARGTLGNLAVVDGKLVAASAAGVCVYPIAGGSDDAE
jgi:outer membrane protein assembly factor BamB